MTCCAPGSPATCAGGVLDLMGVPVCAFHDDAFRHLTGPWKTRNGAESWIRGMREVIAARLMPDVATFRPKPEDTSPAAPFAWVGGSPGWDSDDGRVRVREAKGTITPNIARAKKPVKQGGKRWNPKAWWAKKRKASV